MLSFLKTVFLLKVIILTTIPKATCQLNPEWDYSNDCLGPMKLDGPDKKLCTNIRHEIINIRVTHIDEEAEFTHSVVKNWKNYCYDGSTIDANTGCNQKEKIYQISREEAEEMIERKMCKRNNICEPDSNCWGSDASICLMEERVGWKDFASYNHIGERWLKFPYHTCISSWECNAGKVKLPIYYCPSDTSKICFPLLNGEDCPVSKTVGPLGFTLDKGDQIFGHDIEEKSGIYNFSCYYDGVNKYLCNKEGFPTFEIIGGKGAYRNYKVEMDFMMQTNSVNGGFIHENTHEILLPYKSANLADLQSIVTEMKLDLLNSGYNTKILDDKIHTLEDILLKTIESVSKIDDRLLGKILGVRRRTVWVTSKVFNLCPAEKIGSFETCNGDSAYQNGRVDAGNKDNCELPIQTDVHNITLFKGGNIQLLMVPTLHFDSAARDLQGWTWAVKMIEQNNKHVSESGSSHEDHGSGNWFDDIDFKPFSLSTFKDLFFLVSCIVFWVRIILMRA